MRALAILSTVLFIVSLLVAMVLQSPAGFFVVCIAGAATASFWLRVLYVAERPASKPAGYLVAAAAAWVICFGAIAVQSNAADSEEQAAQDNSGQAAVVLTGTLAGDAEYIGPWSALRDATLSTDGDGNGVIDMAITADSSRPDFDILVTLADGTEVLCESQRRVDWQTDGDIVTLKALCERGLTTAERGLIDSVELSESSRVGRE